MRITMTNDEIWQQVYTLLRKEKKSRTKVQAEQLRAHLDGLLATAEGRKSVQVRFSNDHPFPGKMRFVSEIVRILGNQDLAKLPPEERTSLLHSFLFHAKPTVDPVYWEILWQLQQVGYIQAGRIILESLNKIGSKKEDLAMILSDLQSWQNLSRERALELLETARRSALSSDDIARLDKVITSAKARFLPTQTEPPDKTKNEFVVISGTDTALVEQPMPAAIEPARTNRVAKKVDVQAEPTPPAQAPIAKRPSVTGPNDVIGDEPGGLSECLGDVNRLIEAAFRRQAERMRSVENGLVGAKADLTGIRDHLDRTLVELRATRGQLQRETEITEELRREKIHLEERLAEREHELGRLRGELQQQAQRLTDALQETEGSRRRAEDYIHQADRDKGNAVVTFQTQLWEVLQYYLIEVLEDESDLSSLNEDQRLFRRRLREIKDALREQGIPPV
jgi:hypothetical protein